MHTTPIENCRLNERDALNARLATKRGWTCLFITSDGELCGVSPTLDAGYVPDYTRQIGESANEICEALRNLLLLLDDFGYPNTEFREAATAGHALLAKLEAA